MPLHLLSKKSWNVYAPANIERVKRDEAEAHREAVEQEKRSLQDEADNRLELLKKTTSKERKTLKRKLPGENDTDRDIRLAVETTSTSTSRGKQDDSSVIDADGHIALIPPPQKKPRVDHAQEKDLNTVYLTDATGRDPKSKDTWYTSLQPQNQAWGDDNPHKKQREVARMNANDPLATMKKGIKSLRENEKAGKEWMEQRERDIYEVERLAKQERHERKRKRRRDREGDDLASLEDFNLDEGYTQSKDSCHPHDSESQREQRQKHHHRVHGRHHEHRHRHRKNNSRDSDRDRRHRPRKDPRAQPRRGSQA